MPTHLPPIIYALQQYCDISTCFLTKVLLVSVLMFRFHTHKPDFMLITYPASQMQGVPMMILQPTGVWSSWMKRPHAQCFPWQTSVASRSLWTNAMVSCSNVRASSQSSLQETPTMCETVEQMKCFELWGCLWVDWPPTTTTAHCPLINPEQKPQGFLRWQQCRKRGETEPWSLIRLIVRFFFSLPLASPSCVVAQPVWPTLMCCCEEPSLLFCLFVVSLA